MARSRLSPDPLCSELQAHMQITPEIIRHDRDPRRFASWDHRRTTGYSLARFLNNDNLLPNKAYPPFEATPDSPEYPSSRGKHTPIRPTKFNFILRKPDKFLNSDEPIEVFGLMYPHCQPGEEDIGPITDVNVIFASPLLQEQVHQILCDHSIDKDKMQRNLRYMGVTTRAFLEYCKISYPCHYWVQLGHEL